VTASRIDEQRRIHLQDGRALFIASQVLGSWEVLPQ
jgi:hypothetical protein